MTVRRRKPDSPRSVHSGPESENAGDNTAGEPADDTALVRIAAATRGRATKAQQWLAKYQGLPVVDVVLGVFRRDRRAAGSVMSSALAFRLFLFFLPLLLLTIGVAGFASEVVDARSANQAAGISGGLAKQVSAAFHQPGLTRWVAVLLGLWGVLVAGRSLSRVLYAASAAAWGLPPGNHARLRAVGGIAGLVCTIGVIAILIGRIRESFGIGLASASFLPALLIYAIAWLGVSMFLPRATEDPGALLPGCLLVALTLTVMHAVSELYLPDRLDHASQLYGTFGATVVTLGWFFILGRAVIIAMELNAAIYDRYGSVSQVVFSLPVLRILARRSPRVRRFFDLTDVSD
jgi:membrane protein